MLKTIMIGNLGRDPQSRALDDGTTLVTFPVAVSTSPNKPTTWVQVTAWRKLGDRCGQYLRKGSKVCVVGRMTARAYIGRDGTAKVSLEQTADEVEFLSFRQDDAQAAPATDPETGYEVVEDEDLPY